MTTNMNRCIGWLVILLLLSITIYCEFMVGNSWSNAIMDVVLAFMVFYISYNDANKKSELQQNQINELQKRIEHIEARDSNHYSSNEARIITPTPIVDRENANTR